MLNLIKYLSKYWVLILINIFLLAIQAYCELAVPDYTANIVNIGLSMKTDPTSYILGQGGMMVLITLVSTISKVIALYISSRIAADLGRTLRERMFKKVLSFSNAEMNKFSTASLITRSTVDIQQIQGLIVMLLRTVFFSPIIATGAIIKLTNTDTSMSWIVVIAISAVLAVIISLFSTVMPKMRAQVKLIDKLYKVTREILTGLPVIRAFGTQKRESKRFEDVNTDLTKISIFINRSMSIMWPTMTLIMNGLAVAIIWNGAYSVDMGELQVGDLMAFVQYSMHIVFSFLMISMISIALPRAGVAADRIHEVLETPLSIADTENPIQDTNKLGGIIEFKDVSFKFPDADEYVLENINFIARPGETTAFIGSTGSGKSTIVNLIPRFYDVTQGCISIDGVDIRLLSLHDLRDHIGYIPQKGVLFSGTIESNICYGDYEGSREIAENAAEISQSTEFIMNKKDTFAEAISEGGSNVSGGQKQRLSIARAIAKNPDVLIFDDSFSALDFKTDAKLRAALKEKTKNKTILIVAQRINTVLNADQIIVLDEGKIVGKGTHRELLANCEVYQQIAESQLSKEEIANERA